MSFDPKFGALRVGRGGGWESYPLFVRIEYRGNISLSLEADLFAVRLVRRLS